MKIESLNKGDLACDFLALSFRGWHTLNGVVLV